MTEPTNTQFPALPAEAHGDWRIEFRQLPILHRSHAYYVLIDPSGRAVEELHGFGQSRNTNREMAMGMDGARLVGARRPSNPLEEQEFDPRNKIGEVAIGPYREIVAGKWARGLQAAEEITRRNLDYKGDDVSYEVIGGDGGQIQNSNSAAYTYGKAMALDADSKLREKGIERRFVGWGRDVLDPNYRPYVAPPVLANTITP
mgnify:CR=1 FL=1